MAKLTKKEIETLKKRLGVEMVYELSVDHNGTMLYAYLQEPNRGTLGAFMSILTKDTLEAYTTLFMGAVIKKADNPLEPDSFNDRDLYENHMIFYHAIASLSSLFGDFETNIKKY